MTYWMIGNLVVLFVVIPVVIVLLVRVLKPTLEIKKSANQVLQGGVAVAAELDNVDALLQTRQLVKQVGGGVLRYGAALDRIL